LLQDIRESQHYKHQTTLHMNNKTITGDIVTRREIRLYPQEYKADINKSKGNLKWENGFLALKNGQEQKHVHVEDQVLHLNMEKFLYEDVLALARDGIALKAKSTPSEHYDKALAFIQLALYEIDKQAVKTHGYQGSNEIHVPIPYQTTQ
jgi:hypothetical protein